MDSHRSLFHRNYVFKIRVSLVIECRCTRCNAPDASSVAGRAFAPMGGNVIVAPSVVGRVCASMPDEKRIAKNVPQSCFASIMVGLNPGYLAGVAAYASTRPSGQRANSAVAAAPASTLADVLGANNAGFQPANKLRSPTQTGQTQSSVSSSACSKT